MSDLILRTVYLNHVARGWSDTRQSFVASFEADTLNASLLMIDELGFLPADDPRFAATVTAVGMA